MPGILRDSSVGDMASVLKFLGICLIAAAAGAGASLVLHLVHTQSLPANDDIKYTDFLSITLTALSLMITVLGLFLAAAGVIGWTTLESRLKAHSVEYFSKQLDKDSQLRKELEQLIVKVASSGIEGLGRKPEDERPYSD